MAHDVFVSYSTKDKPIADAVCATLEADGIRCWIAPRDIRAGMSWTAAIMDGIAAAKVMVLVWSTNANLSPEVTREVQHAFSMKVTVIPFRVQDVTPSKDLAYYLKFVHWLDAITPPLENHLQELVEHVGANLPQDSRVLRTKEAKPQYAEASPQTKTEGTVRDKEEEVRKKQIGKVRQLAETRERRKRWAESEKMLSSAAAEERERIEKAVSQRRKRKVNDEYIPEVEVTGQTNALGSSEKSAEHFKVIIKLLSSTGRSMSFSEIAQRLDDTITRSHLVRLLSELQKLGLIEMSIANKYSPALYKLSSGTTSTVEDSK